MTRVRKEEYSSLGDFIANSFERDQAEIMARYPKLDNIFLNTFKTKLASIKVLESGLVLSDAQRNATATLYAEAVELNDELNFLKSYFKEANLDFEIIESLKKDLFKFNIEGAILKIESLKQFIYLHQSVLVEEGMQSGFVAVLDSHIASLAIKNASQNSFMNASKALTDANKTEYDELYTMIRKIASSGKLVFSKTIFRDEYIVTKIIMRMRAPKAATAT